MLSKIYTKPNAKQRKTLNKVNPLKRYLTIYNVLSVISSSNYKIIHNAKNATARI